MISSIKRFSNRRKAEVEALRWLFKISRNELSVEQLEEFTEWLCLDACNSEAYTQFVAIMYNVPPLSQLDIDALHGQKPPLARIGQNFTGWPWKAAGFACAIFALVIISTLYLFYSGDNQTYSASVGKRQHVALSDNSRVDINSQSRVTVNYTEGVRFISLPAGEAFFEVAHDKSRPFVVQTDRAVIRALGTKFNVRTDKGETIVSVLEGAVEVKAEPASEDTSITKEVVTAGQKIELAEGSDAPRKTTVNIERDTSWRFGRVEFDDMRLETAVKEINRYRQKEIIVSDPELKSVHITGSFNIDETSDFLRAMSRMDFIEVVETDSAVKLVKVR